MNIDALIGTQSVMITLDVDSLVLTHIERLVDKGFSLIELNTVDVVLLREVIEAYPALRVGAGNITTIEQLETAHQANVHFMTSPGFLQALVQTASVYNVPYLPGVSTVSEAMHALSMGCQYVRPYPATQAFCDILSDCLPTLRLLPAGVAWQDAAHFLQLPAVAAVSVLNPTHLAHQEIAFN